MVAREADRSVPRYSLIRGVFFTSKELFPNAALKKLILPLVIEQVLAITVGLADTMMVSSVGEAAVSGVSLVDMLNVLIINIFSALATGGAVVVAQLLGARKNDRACDASKQLYLVVTVIALIISALVMLFRAPLLRLLFGTIEDDVMQSALTYLTVSVFSYPVLAIYNAGAALFRAQGNSRISMLIAGLINIVNLIGNSVTIFWLGWGVMGAGLATLISRSVGAYITQRALRDLHCRIPYPGMFPFEWHPSEVKKILSVGIPSGFENGLFQLGKLLLLSMIATFGTASTAANAVGNTLGSFQCLPGNAIGLAMIAVVGQCCGAHAYDQAKFYTKKLMQIVYLCMGTLNILMLLCNPIITLPFNLSPEAYAMALEVMVWFNIVSLFIWPSSFTMPNILRAAGDARFTMTVSIVSMWAFRVGFCYLCVLAFHGGLLAIWMGMYLDWAFRSLCFFVRFVRGKWLEQNVI